MFTLLAEEGGLADWREAFHYRHLQVGGDAASSACSARRSPRRPEWRPRGAGRRAASQLMHRPAAVRHPVDVVRLAGPVQAQEPRAARLAFRARARGLTAADVDRARTEERSLLRAWCMRKTIHLIAAEDAGWILPLFAPIIVRWSRKRLADFGLDRRGQDRALKLLHDAVDADGPLTRPELGERLERAGFETGQEFKVHLWLLATLDGEPLPRSRPRRPDLPGADRGLDRPARARGRATSRSPSSRAATCAATRRPTSATWRAGPACRCATPGSRFERIAPSSPAQRRAETAPRRRGHRSCGCWALTTTTTSATSTAAFAIGQSTSKQIAPAAGSCARRSPSTGASSAPGPRSAAASGWR